MILPRDLRHFIVWNMANHFILYYQLRRHHNCFITQLGTSCAFDSGGVGRDAPPRGEHPQGDSTP